MSIKDVVPKNRKVKIAHESLDEGVKHVSKFKPIFDLDEMYELVDVDKWEKENPALHRTKLNEGQAIYYIREHMIAHQMNEKNAVLIIKALKMAIEALSTRIPCRIHVGKQSPFYCSHNEDSPYCPACGKEFNMADGQPRYCPSCGQTLDWSEVEE